MRASVALFSVLLASFAGSAVAAPRRIDPALLKRGKKGKDLDEVSGTATAIDPSATVVSDGSVDNSTLSGNGTDGFCNSAGVCGNVTVSNSGSIDNSSLSCGLAGCTNITGSDLGNSTLSNDTVSDNSTTATTTGLDGVVTVTVTVTAADCLVTDNSNSTLSNSTDTNLTDSGTTTLSSFALTSTLGVDSIALPTATANPAAVTIQNGDGAISVIPVPTGTSGPGLLSLVKALEAGGENVGKLKGVLSNSKRSVTKRRRQH